ncbi:winged helix-turn-helix domain-containing protein, partial [Microbispora sp. GKU 823]|uniref:winged helix-turn-helix domain-containing protein n=1 Tax=Microbispora sp. GKU 823 TaxID=1652100 RepID=UPI0009C684F4
MAEADPRLRALAHPVRLRMLSLMWGAPMSAAELSRELGISHALASHHLRCLDEAGLAELAGVRVRRGGRERRYRAAGGTPLTERGTASRCSPRRWRGAAASGPGAARG